MSILDDLNALLSQRQTTIEDILDTFTGRELSSLLDRFAELVKQYAKGKRFSTAQVAAISTSEELLRLLDKAGLSNLANNVARRFAPVARSAKAALRVAGVSSSLDLTVLNRLITARSTAVIEKTASPVIAAVKAAWIDSVFLGTPIPDAIETAILSTKQAAQGAARTEFGTMLNSIDQAASLAGAAETGGEVYYLYIGPVDQRTRPTCRIASDKAWTAQQIAKLDNGQIANVLLNRGGWNCRHHWQPASKSLVASLSIPLATAADIRDYNGAAER